MSLNLYTCKGLTFLHYPNVFRPYFLHNTNLTSWPSYKHLGVHLINDLSWQTHICNIVYKSRETLEYMRHMLKLAPSCVKLIAYQTLVPPKLEYTSSVRSPRQSYLADKFELVQNGALCFIFSDYTSPTRVLGLRVKAGIQSPTLCRQISRLTILNKIYCHNQGLKDTLLSPPAKIFQH